MANDLNAFIRQAQDRARLVPRVAALGILVPLLVGGGIVAYSAWQVAAKQRELAALDQRVAALDQRVKDDYQQLAYVQIKIAQATKQDAAHPQSVQATEALAQAGRVAGWNLAPPEQAWCYQERDLGLQSGQYSVHCNWSLELCNKTKGTRDPGLSPPNKHQTACALSTELPSTGWKPSRFGYQGSWYQLNLESPFPAHFPRF